jgi:hypothetical protein
VLSHLRRSRNWCVFFTRLRQCALSGFPPWSAALLSVCHISLLTRLLAVPLQRGLIDASEPAAPDRQQPATTVQLEMVRFTAVSPAALQQAHYSLASFTQYAVNCSVQGGAIMGTCATLQEELGVRPVAVAGEYGSLSRAELASECLHPVQQYACGGVLYLLHYACSDARFVSVVDRKRRARRCTIRQHERRLWQLPHRCSWGHIGMGGKLMRFCMCIEGRHYTIAHS